MGRDISLSPVEASGIIPSNPLGVFIQPLTHALVISSQVCTDQYTAEDLKDSLYTSLRVSSFAMAGMAQWIECWHGNQKVASSILVMAHAWVVGQVLSWGCAGGNQLMFLSLFSPSFLLSLKVNKKS